MSEEIDICIVRSEASVVRTKTKTKYKESESQSNRSAMHAHSAARRVRDRVSKSDNTAKERINASVSAFTGKCRDVYPTLATTNHIDFGCSTHFGEMENEEKD